MKKILALLLVLCLGTLVLAGCGEESAGSTSASGTENSTSTSGTENGEAASSSETSESKKSGEEITFSGMEVVNNDECSIDITEIGEDSRGRFTMTAELENKSADKTYMYAVEDAYINGVQCDPGFATTVAPGKKSIENISFSSSRTETLDNEGVGDYTDIEISFRVYDSDDWQADHVADVTVHVYPYGEEKATTFSRELKESDVVLVDNEYATVVLLSCNPDDSYHGYSLSLYLVNKTDTPCMYAARDVSVNGYMCNGTLAEVIAAGRSGFTDMTWSNSALEQDGIDASAIDNIEFTLVVYDDNNYTDYFVEQPVTINP